MTEENYYNIFLDFINKYLPLGFKGVDKSDPLVSKMREHMIKHEQFFYVADMIKMEILFTCDTIKEVWGMDPNELDPSIMFAMTAPEDIQRHSISRSRMIRLCNDTFINSDEFGIMSTNLGFQNQNTGKYSNYMVQAYAFSRKVPANTVYALFVQTNIDWFGKIKHGYHYYIGKDMSFFRKPDKELIMTGCVFTDREHEILVLLKQGLDSKDIGQKLFLSTHTVDTHRRNILKKTGKPNTSELIIELMERGFF